MSVNLELKEEEDLSTIKFIYDEFKTFVDFKPASIGFQGGGLNIREFLAHLRYKNIKVGLFFFWEFWDKKRILKGRDKFPGGG